MSRWTDTGRRRFRTFWLSKREHVLVLQIEERGLVTEMRGPFPDSEWMTRWRDATVEDIGINIRVDVEAVEVSQ